MEHKQGKPFDISTQKHQAVFDHLSSKKVTLGFDGFIDSIVRIVRETHEDGDRYFETSNEFANYILDKQSKSFSFELREFTRKLGGNMPIMSNALARLGPKLDCIGAFGLPRIHEVFLRMPGNCTLYSFAEPGYSSAMEFRDSKMMMAEMKGINEVTWEKLTQIIGLQKITELFSNRDLICVLNWSEIENSSDIWKGLLRDVLPAVDQSSNAKPIAIFDFSDCSKKPREKIVEALDLIKQFAVYWDVIVSLNLNEATLTYKALMNTDHQATPDEMGESLYQNLGIYKLIVHCSTEALCWDEHGAHQEPTTFVKEPKLLTGAGDNFNAGFCAALLLNQPTSQALKMGHAVSGYYLRKGESPSLEQVIRYMETKENLVSKE